ncbi:MAG: SufD family Fe-S cluster assembly protein [Candidatus Moraniibacteriota bacterium]
MQFRDISQDYKNTYRLGQDEKAVFFMLNRSGDVVFELAESGAEAHIFSFFIGKNADTSSLRIRQQHLAPKTVSHTLVKSVVSDESRYTYEGLIFIAAHAPQSDASQESRALLLSPDAFASMNPVLEILADDVKCRHAATASPLNREALFFAETRGLSPAQAKTLLVQGFFNDALLKIEDRGIDTQAITATLKEYLQAL